mgnify:CR=1 FL=1
MTKFIFVTGGVVSSLGKGLTSASIGMLLEGRGLNVRMQKLDPYINVDPGTMSPYQHGEVYVLDDGSEVANKVRVRITYVWNATFVTGGPITLQAVSELPMTN